VVSPHSGHLADWSSTRWSRERGTEPGNCTRLSTALHPATNYWLKLSRLKPNDSDCPLLFLSLFKPFPSHRLCPGAAPSECRISVSGSRSLLPRDAGRGGGEEAGLLSGGGGRAHTPQRGNFPVPALVLSLSHLEVWPSGQCCRSV